MIDSAYVWNQLSHMKEGCSGPHLFWARKRPIYCEDLAV